MNNKTKKVYSLSYYRIKIIKKQFDWSSPIQVWSIIVCWWWWSCRPIWERGNSSRGGGRWIIRGSIRGLGGRLTNENWTDGMNFLIIYEW